MSFKRLKVEKLVRDLTPEKLQAKNIAAHIETLEHENYIAQLKKKLLEESIEVQEASNRSELTIELADLLEVMCVLSKASGISLAEIQDLRHKKRETHGGFERKIYNSFIDIEESNPHLEFYSKKYPQQHLHHDKESSSDCFFCHQAIHEKKDRIIARFKHCYVYMDEFPVSEGHLLIVPYNHTENWFTASDEVRHEMMDVVHLMKQRLDSEYHPDGYNIGANCGKSAGQSVMHLHLHLIPRYQGDMPDPKGGVRGVIPSKQKY